MDVDLLMGVAELGEAATVTVEAEAVVDADLAGEIATDVALVAAE